MSNPVYEKTCDFTSINLKAEELLKEPCHLVINDLSTCADVKVELNEDILNSLSDMITVSVGSSDCDRLVQV